MSLFGLLAQHAQHEASGAEAMAIATGFRTGLLLYVFATVLPLFSFVVLLVLRGVRCAFNLPTKTRGQGSAYIATTAIAGSFVLSLIGFILHSQDHGHTAELWQDKAEWIRIGSEQEPTRLGTALQLGYHIDNLTSIMFLMVTFIATLIHIFSLGYMRDELAETVEDHQVPTPPSPPSSGGDTGGGHLKRRGRFGRFFMYLSLFCFSMLNLVLADNLFQVFVSWELVGICSYLLIGHYYERTSASNAANKAFITNRVGDAGFIVGLLIIWTHVGTFNFQEIFERVRAPLLDDHKTGHLELGGQFVRVNEVAHQETGRTVEVSPDGALVLLMGRHIHDANDLAKFQRDDKGQVLKDKAGQPVKFRIDSVPEAPVLGDFNTIPYWMLVLAGLGIFMGCVGKSAQYPLQVWLPDAMEGPTPVSALIHAATMVAAGVYLVGRVYPLFTEEVRLAIAYTGAVTLFVAATVAIVMTDIKKVLAYSTVSQLGYMMLALGVGGWVAGLFHLLTHAFFKALLFLGSGSVIFGCHHEQEMTKMGGLLKKMPITAFTMLMGVLAIAGTPFFTGWYSKDAILAAAYGFVVVHPEHTLLFVLPLLTAGITTFYMFRMWFLTFTGAPRDAHVYEHAHESPKLMTIPLIILAVCSVCVAWGWPLWDAEASHLERHVHHAQHHAVIADLGHVLGSDLWAGRPLTQADQRERHYAHEGHALAGGLALFAAGVGFIFGYLIYKRKVLDPAEAKEQFPGVHDFLAHKWYFDEVYSVMLVRPALRVAYWCRAFDTYVIDGFVDWLGRFTVRLARWDGRFDNGVIDGLANLSGNVVYRTGTWLRHVQTGYLRSYILFLVLAAIGLFAVLKYFIGLAAAG